MAKEYIYIYISKVKNHRNQMDTDHAFILLEKKSANHHLQKFQKVNIECFDINVKIKWMNAHTRFVAEEEIFFVFTSLVQDVSIT